MRALRVRPRPPSLSSRRAACGRRRDGGVTAARGPVHRAQIMPAPATVSRSLASSATEASIRTRENSSISRSLHDPVLAAPHGAREAADEALGDAVGAVGRDAHRDPVRRSVPATQSRTWSIAALAAEAAEEAPRASMIAAPRLPTLGRNSFSIHSLVVDDLGRRATAVYARVVTGPGTCVGEWLPHTPIWVISSTPARRASSPAARSRGCGPAASSR